MKARGWLRRILSGACIYFTVATLILYTVGSLTSEDGYQRAPRLETMYMLLVFCILFEGANYLVLRTRLPGALKLLLHYGVCTVIFSGIFLVWGRSSVTAGGVFVVLVTYTLFYGACALILFLIRHFRRDKENRASDYESQFQNLKK